MQLSEEETENNEYIINAKSEINEGVNHCKKNVFIIKIVIGNGKEEM